MKNLFIAIMIVVVSAIIFMASREPHETQYTEYRVLQRCGFNNSKVRLQFQEAVSSWMKEGWVPVGGIEVIDDHGTCYYQALTR